MGTWGTGPFENDDAADLLGDVSELVDQQAVQATLLDTCHAITGSSDYLEAPEVARAVAAAALIALGAEAPPSASSPFPHTVTTAIANLGAPGRAVAAAALQRALTPRDNEWYELWTDAGLQDEVSGALSVYQAALAD